jgi:hypothetical protein
MEDDKSKIYDQEAPALEPVPYEKAVVQDSPMVNKQFLHYCTSRTETDQFGAELDMDP